MKTKPEKINEILADLERFVAWKMASGQETINFSVNIVNGNLASVSEFQVQYPKNRIKRLTYKE